MRPHEQEWEHDGKGVVWNKGRLADLVHQPTPGHAQGPDEVLARGAAIAAVPRMIRLLMQVDGHCESAVTCAMARSGTFPESGLHECVSCRAGVLLREIGERP